jgi:nucleotide-binding universal stress UspA family protein
MTLVKDAPTISRFDAAKMAFRTLLVHAQPEPGAKHRLAGAAALARNLDATLVGVCAEMVQPFGYVDAFGAADAIWLPEAQALVTENLERAATAFKQVARDVSHTCVKVEEFPVAAMVELSAGADLIVAGGYEPADRDGYRWCDPAETAIKSGRPVLVLPRTGGALQIRRILVAWKNTREARRAVADAMPFLKGADEVVVVSVFQEGDAEVATADTNAVVGHLKRHGVSARAKTVMSIPALAPSELQKCAAELKADLVVSGAYGHTRLGEWIFGGVTRSLLEAGDRHLLISH